MPNTTVYTNNQYYQDIADAIRAKNGTQNTYTPPQMAPAINELIVSGSVTNQNKSVTPTESQQLITADSGYTGLGTVTVGAIPSTYITPTGTLNIDDDGTYDVTNYASAEVDINYSSKAISVTVVNHRNRNMSISQGVLINSVVSSSTGYITTNPTASIAANTSTTILVPTGCMLVFMSNKSYGNFDLYLNNTKQTPRVVGNANVTSDIGFYKVYGFTQANLTGTVVIDLYDSSDPIPSTAILDTLTVTENNTYTAPAGTAYSSVVVNVPTGGTSVDISDTTAVAADVASGKYFYTADGTKTVGTAETNPTISEITISSSGAVSQQLQPDTIYHFTSTALTDLTLTFASVTSTAQYHFDFISPSTAVNLTLPQSVNMPSNFTVEANTRYEIDVINNYGVFAE